MLNDWAIEFQRTLAALRVRGDAPAPRRRRRRRRGAPRGRPGVPRRVHADRPAVRHAPVPPRRVGTRSGPPPRRPALVLGFHIGTEPHTPEESTGVYFRGPGGAVLNYVETTYGGQRCTTQLIASGALDRHPDLKVLVSEGGATWGPFLADRMDEAYRQHGFATCRRSCRSCRASTSTAGVRVVPARPVGGAGATRHGLAERDVGQRLPAPRGHLRPHARRRCTSCSTTSTTRRGRRITVGAFQELFPHVPPAPGD